MFPKGTARELNAPLSFHLVVVGAHTIGLARCATFRPRSFNFSSTGEADSTMNTSMVSDLQSLCPINGDGNKTAYLDSSSSDLFDKHYFKNLLDAKGLLRSDQNLWHRPPKLLLRAIARISAFSSMTL